MNLNRVTLIGQVIHDPACRRLDGQPLMTKFTLATTSRPDDGTEEHVEHFPVVALGELAEKCAELLLRGRFVYLEGDLRTERFVDDRKVMHARTEVWVSQVVLLDRNQPSRG